MIELRVTVLGPVTLRVDGRLADLSGRARDVLAVLARSGEVVSDVDLIARVWGERVPKTVANQLQIAVHRVRAALPDGRTLLRRERGGYILDVPTDLDELRAHVAEGDGAAKAGRWHAAHTAYAAATALCEDVPAELAEEALDALIRRQVAALLTDRQAEILADAVAPGLNERLWHLRVLATAVGDREAALRLHDRATAALAEDAGLDPGREFRQLREALAEGDLAREIDVTRRWITGGSGRPTPMELPPATGDFVGREEEAELVRRALERGIVTVTGLGGVGKTTLAVRVAREAAHRYPDGCLFTDLRGADESPREPHAVLGTFLRSLGVKDAEVPADPDARLNLYRSLTSGRRLLIVLDNAFEAAQVRDLLPGGPGCATVVTSRTALPGLDGDRVAVESLPQEKAVDLLAAVADRREDEDVMRQVAELAGRLPLALRIIGARLRRRRDLGFRRMLARLTDDRHRLDELADGDRMVRSCIDIGYRRLSPRATEAIRAAAWLPVGRFTLGTLAGTLGLSIADTERVLDDLLDAQLMIALDEEDGELARYTLHDLVRLFVRDTDPDPEERRTTLVRGYRRLVPAMKAGVLPIRGYQFFPPDVPPAYPEVPSPPDPLPWLAAHQEYAVAAVGDARALGEPEIAWLLAANMVAYLIGRCQWDEFDAALGEVADLDDVPERRATLRWATAKALSARDQPAAAIAPLREARVLFRRLGDDLRAAAVAWDMVSSLRQIGEHRAAIAAGEWGVARLGAGDLGKDALGLRGWLSLSLGNVLMTVDPHRAAEHYRAAAEAMRAVNNPPGEANALAMLGRWHGLAGRHAEAVPLFQRALELYTGDKSLIGVLFTRMALADQYIRGGEFEAAEELLAVATVDAAAAGQRGLLAQAGRARATIHQRRGEPAEAIAEAEAALVLARETTNVESILHCLRLVVEIAADAGDAERVARAREEALASAPEGHPQLAFFTEPGLAGTRSGG